MSTRHNQSIRSSCDRCRSQKLKCTVSSESSRSGAHQCVRCIRAQATCVFGRRSQSRRSSDLRKSTAKIRESEPFQTPAESSPPVESTSLSGLFLDSPSLLGGTWSEDLAGQEVEERLGTGVNTTSGLSMSDGCFWTELGGNQGISLFGLASPCLPADGHPPQSPVTYNHSASAVAPNMAFSADDFKEGQSSASELSDRPSPHAIVQLSTLVAEIHETSRALEGPWSNMSNSKQLINYPIGRVLSLSQEFITTLSCIWLAKSTESNQPTCAGTSSSHSTQESSPSPPPREPAEMSSYSELLSSIEMAQKMFVSIDKFAASTSSSVAASVDMPTMLLILSCYISLTKLYSLVFAHFESHLSQLPEAPPPHCSQPVGVTGWGLQLGELRSADETCTKVCTALQMLLDAFQSVEDIVGLPRSLSAVRQRTNAGDEVEPDADVNRASLWTAFLAQSVFKLDAGGTRGDEHEEIRRLPMKVRSLKALIRAKMNL
ncbi:hypothetical protein B0T10DRAFT_233641 [Thelonectria olida]|uniref:Zn(2)-C6 fungal-type domain-containing protein n=1 Tax=Thelonectria olida TaxID=1576542 RepID=A0A9P8VR42_9HYPO|nr:hypothetical protein B0T10DRAFT_233641 [Thelonectria olida]